jgi:hypothetical protein
MMTVATLLATTNENEVGFIYIGEIFFIMNMDAMAYCAFLVPGIKIELGFIYGRKKICNIQKV